MSDNYLYTIAVSFPQDSRELEFRVTRDEETYFSADLRPQYSASYTLLGGIVNRFEFNVRRENIGSTIQWIMDGNE